MNTCEVIRRSFIEAYYEELSEEQRMMVNQHLASCPACASEYKRVTAALDRMGYYNRPEPDAAFWDRYWDNLQDRLDRESTGATPELRWLKVFASSFLSGRIRVFRPVIAGAALFFIGMLTGWFFFSGHPTPPIQTMQPLSPQMETVSVHDRAQQYLNRAELILLGIANFDVELEPDYLPSFDQPREMSRDLIAESVGLKEELQSAKQRHLFELIDELEVILLEIANLATDYTIEDIELIQGAVERKAILFKLNINDIVSQG